MEKALSGSQQATSGTFVTRKESPSTQGKLLKDELAEIIHQAVRDNRSYLMEHESKEILEGIGIATTGYLIARSEDEALAICDKIGFPVVMKIVSPDAVHKSDAGGVITGIETAEAVRSAFDRIRRNLDRCKKDARFEGIRVMKQAGEGYDMFIGGQRDASFGPVVSFGYGGIYIEVFKDVAHVLCPAGSREIEEKIRKLKSCKILQGARGKGAGDIPGYAAAIERVSHLLHQFPQIRELDVNPLRVLADGSGVVALDARIRIVPNP